MTILKIGDGAFVEPGFPHDEGKQAQCSRHCKGNVQLGVLDSQRLSREYSAMSSQLKNIMTSLDRRLKRVTERHVETSIIPNMPEYLLNDVRPLIMQGQTEKKLFKIINGKAFIVRQTEHGMMLLSELGHGDHFGNIPFVDIGHEPYSDSVFASRELETIQVDVENLQQEYEQLSLTFRNIVTNVGTCISTNDYVQYLRRQNAEDNQ